MRIKIYYNRNLKMTEGKIASQVAHVAKELGRKRESNAAEDEIIVLKASISKIKELMKGAAYEGIVSYGQVDLGMTEVKHGELTAWGIICE